MQPLTDAPVSVAQPTTHEGAPTGAPSARLAPRPGSAPSFFTRNRLRHIPVTLVRIAPEPRFGPGAWGVTYDVEDPQGTLASIELYSDHPPRDPWGNIDADALMLMIGLSLTSPAITWKPDIFAPEERGLPFMVGCRAVIRDFASGEWERVAAYARGKTPAPNVLVDSPAATLQRLIPLLDLRHTLLEVERGAA